MSKTNYISGSTVTNYDGIAKQLLDNMDDVKMITFINYTFSKSFRKDASVTRLATETYDSETKQRRCDYFVKINDDMFLIEIQSYEDDEMALRIFEYGNRGAVLHARKIIDDDTIDIQFPEPVVFYLRKGEKVHDKLSVRIHRAGSDEEYRYDARVIYVEDYGMNALIETGMLPLIPFYPMRYEKMLNIKHSEDDENSILKDFSESYELLKQAVRQNLFSAEYCYYLKESMIKVFGGVVARMNKSGKMKKEQEANELMKTMIDEPIEMFDIFQAMECSKEKGKAEGIIQLGRMKNLSDEQIVSDIAVILEISVEDALDLLTKYDTENAAITK